MRPHPWLRRTLVSRLDRSVASGLLLTVALGAAIAGGLVLGLLAYLIRSFPATQRLDNSAAAWGFDHRTEVSTRGLHLVTDLGTAQVVIALAARHPGLRLRTDAGPVVRSVPPGGDDRRGVPDALRQGSRRSGAAGVRPRGRTPGPSFPSGHSSTSAAFYAAAALVLTRYAHRPVRIVVIGVAVSIAVAVAASRVLLDYHWLSDVVGGLALGWGWFALCAVVFGGRLLRPTAAIDVAASTATKDETDAADGASRALRDPVASPPSKASTSATDAPRQAARSSPDVGAPRLLLYHPLLNGAVQRPTPRGKGLFITFSRQPSSVACLRSERRPRCTRQARA